MELQEQQQQAVPSVSATNSIVPNEPVEFVADTNEQLCLVQQCDALTQQRDQLLKELRDMRRSEPTKVLYPLVLHAFVRMLRQE